MNGSPYACVIQAVVLGGSANLTEKLLTHHHDESDEAAASLANLVLHMQYTKSHKSLPILLMPHYRKSDAVHLARSYLSEVLCADPLHIWETSSCGGCGEESEFLDSVPILCVGMTTMPTTPRSKVLLQDLVDGDFSKESITCGGCQSPLRQRSSVLKSAPKDLVVVAIKSTPPSGVSVTCPDKLELVGAGGALYGIRSMIVFHAPTAHYVAYRLILSQWYLFDDCSVRACAPPHRGAVTPCLVVYTKKSNNREGDESAEGGLTEWIQDQDAATPPEPKAMIRKPLTGIYNLGHASYASSCVQALLGFDEVKERMTDSVLREPNVPETLAGSLTQLCLHMQLTRYRSVTPKEFHGRLPPPFNDYQAHDAAAFFSVLVEALGRDYADLLRVPPPAVDNAGSGSGGHWACGECFAVLPPESAFFFKRMLI